MRRLSWRERRLLAAAAVWLPATAVLLRAVGLARCEAILAHLFKLRRPPYEAERLEPARVTARLVRIAAERGLYRATCLPQSLVLWSLLRRTGTETTLHVGVRKSADRVEAHAWVECDGVALNDDADVNERFAAFDRAVAR